MNDINLKENEVEAHPRFNSGDVFYIVDYDTNISDYYILSYLHNFAGTQGMSFQLINLRTGIIFRNSLICYNISVIITSRKFN